MRESQVQSILANQLTLWEQYTKMNWVADDTVKCELADGIMPDNQPCRGLIKCKSKKDAVDQWYTYVRSQYDARTAEQEAAAAKRAEASRASSGKDDPAPGVDGGGKVPDTQAVPDSEASVEKILMSQIAVIGRSILGLKAERKAAARTLELLDARLEKLKDQRSKAIAAFKVVSSKEALDGSTSADAS